MSLKYRPEIDGLRAIALILVLFFHAGFAAFSGGFVGVDVFFVISGYLITHIIIAEKKTDEFSIINFYERRTRRILPALFFMMLLVLLPAWILMMPHQFKDFGQSLASVALFSSNFLFWRKSGYFEASVELKPLLHTWSLAVEEQFYILYPLCLSWLWKRGPKKILSFIIAISIGSLVLSQILSSRDPIANFYFPTSRAWELLIGAMIAFNESFHFLKFNFSSKIKNILAMTGLGLILSTTFLYSSATPFPSVYALLPVVGAALIILFAHPNNLLGQLLSSRVFVGLGLISYSAYLWHQPLFAFARLSLLTQPTPIHFGILICLTFLLATLSYKYIEQPFRDRSRWTFKKIIGSASVVSLLFIGLGVFLHFTNGLQNQASALTLNLIKATESINPRQKECEAGPGHYIAPSKACALGDQNAEARIALIGDSHADALFDSLDKTLKKNNKKSLFLSYAACPPITGLTLLTAPQTHLCREYNDDVFSFLIQSNQIETIVMAARWTIYIEGNRFNNGQGGSEFGSFIPATVFDKIAESKNENERQKFVAQAYQSSVLKLLNKGKKVILIYPTPEVGWNVPEYLFKSVHVWQKKLTLDSASTDFAVYQKRNQKALAALDAIGDHPNLIRIYPEKIFCNSVVPNRCVTHENGIPFYYDDNHLTQLGASKIIEQIQASKIDVF